MDATAMAAEAKRLGLAAKRRRKELGLSLDTVGERTGLRWNALSDLEDGDPATPIEAFVKVATVLDMRVDLSPVAAP